MASAPSEAARIVGRVVPDGLDDPVEPGLPARVGGFSTVREPTDLPGFAAWVTRLTPLLHMNERDLNAIPASMIEVQEGQACSIFGPSMKP